ncbi:MAG: zf-HC2 domain-containing protein [Anaerolineales bacterium]
MSALSHTQAQQWIEQAADGILQPDQQQLLQQHLKGCAKCRAFAAQLSALEHSLRGALLARWPQEGLPPGGKKELSEQLKSQFGKGGGGAAPWTILKWLGPLLLLSVAALLWLSSQAPPLAAATATPTASRTATATPSLTVTLPALQILTDTPEELTLIAIPIQTANCREGNGSVFEVDDTLFEGEAYIPNARGFDNQWVRFLGPVTENQCWVYVANLEFFINDRLTAIQDIPELLLPFVPYPATPTASPTPTFPPEPPIAQCSDGFDNDGDGRIDYSVAGAGDRECRSADDNDEAVP